MRHCSLWHKSSRFHPSISIIPSPPAYPPPPNMHTAHSTLLSSVCPTTFHSMPSLNLDLLLSCYFSMECSIHCSHLPLPVLRTRTGELVSFIGITQLLLNLCLLPWGSLYPRMVRLPEGWTLPRSLLQPVKWGCLTIAKLINIRNFSL